MQIPPIREIKDLVVDLIALILLVLTGVRLILHDWRLLGRKGKRRRRSRPRKVITKPSP